MKASDLFVKALENEGVKYVFGIPGEENLDFLESLKNSNIQLILTRHEQAAGFMAATYGRLTHTTGVCLSTLGPGATNLVTAVAYAQLGGMPLLVITGQKPIKTSKQGKFQIINVVDMMKPITKYCRSIVNGNSIPSMVREVFRISLEERPGAVHLELPEDIAKEETNTNVFSIHPKERPRTTDKVIDKACKLIESAKRPLILIGVGPTRHDCVQALSTFIEKTQIPFFNTQMGKGVVDENNPLYLGTAALSDHDFLHCAVDRSDLIINFGHDIIEKPPFIMHSDGPKVIHVNHFFSRADSVYFPQLDVVGDIAENINLLTQAVNKKEHWDFSYFMKMKKLIGEALALGSKDDAFPILPQRLVADVQKAMPKDGIVTLDNGVYKIWFARNYRASLPNTLLLDNALATMGAGFPSAIGARLVYPDRKIAAICGDGGFMMNSQELETAVRLKLNLVVIILNDSSYGMIKWKQEQMGLEVQGLDFNNPDFVQYARSYGAKGYRINAANEFYGVLKQCLKTPGVHLIDLPIDYRENSKVLINDIENITCTL
ncbi:MAG: acetolactate synthase large subunit [Deltaproteobacteria bacterium]|jgi:acetolactate synthase-1/2/3 large subunit|nr:acetolactate synthase large subunit [Deltaproteobacteria bacterium]